MKALTLLIITSLFVLSNVSTVSAFRGHPHKINPHVAKEQDIEKVMKSCRPGDTHGCS